MLASPQGFPYITELFNELLELGGIDRRYPVNGVEFTIDSQMLFDQAGPGGQGCRWQAKSQRRVPVGMIGKAYRLGESLGQKLQGF